MSTSLDPRRTPLAGIVLRLVITLVSAGWSNSALARQARLVVTNAYGYDSPNPVRVQAIFENKTGQPVNDFHASIQASGSNIDGAVARSQSFPTKTYANKTANSFEIQFSGRDVPNRQSADIDITAFSHDKKFNNGAWSWWWTQNGNQVGAVHSIKFSVANPTYDPTGRDGLMANQSVGGGTGGYSHDFTLSNPGNIPLLVTGIAYDATMTYVDRIDSVPWNTIPMSLANPITLQLNEELTIPFDTLGAHAGGEILFKIDSDNMVFQGAHPVPSDPEPAACAMLAGLALAGFAAGRRMRAPRPAH